MKFKSYILIILFHFLTTFCFCQNFNKQIWIYRYDQNILSENIPFTEIVFLSEDECSIIIESDSSTYCSFYKKFNKLFLSKISGRCTNYINVNNNFVFKYKINKNKKIVYIYFIENKKRYKLIYDLRFYVE